MVQVKPIRRVRIVSKSSVLHEAQVLDHESGLPIHCQAFTVSGNFMDGPNRGRIMATITLPAQLDLVAQEDAPAEGRGGMTRWVQPAIGWMLGALAVTAILSLTYSAGDRNGYDEASIYEYNRGWAGAEASLRCGEEVER